MKQLKTLVFALLPLMLAPALVMAQATQDRAGEQDRPGATQQQPRTGQQPGTQPRTEPGQPGATGQQQRAEEERREEQAQRAQQQQRQQQPGATAQQQRQQQPGATAQQQRQRMTGQAAIIQRQEMDQFRADNLIGSSVQNMQGEEIGQISDLLLDRDGNVVGLVVGVGGFLGVGERDVALSWDAIQLTTDQDGEPIAQVDMDQQTLERAPEFERRDDRQGWGNW
jgi:sporulation protein YlmC with PRC-barrel domain